MDDQSTTEPALTFLEHDCIGQETREGARLYEMSIKVRPGGLLAVLRVVGDQGSQVAFVGAGGFLSLARKVRDALQSEDTSWREDKYR